MEVENEFGYHFNEEENSRRSRVRTRNGGSHDVLPRTRRRNVKSRRKTVATPRRNRPNSEITGMNLQCCTEKTCLLNHGRRVISIIRRDFDLKLYEDQNNLLSSLIDITRPNDKRTSITYNIRDISGLAKVKVCKTAFLKIFGIGKKRIAVLLRKIQPYSGDVEKDQRRFSRNERKLSLTLKAEVVEHIRSYEREQSHYARHKTRDRQFLAPSLSIVQLWRDFLAKKGCEDRNNLPLCLSSFKNIFRTFKLSFRRPYVDTCAKCDSLSIIMRYSKDETEIAATRQQKNEHVSQADEHYDCIHFDLKTLPQRKNKANGTRPWVLPPAWE